MNILNFAKLYFVAVPIFFALDMLWLVVIAKDTYQKYMGHLMKPMPNWPVAILFYLLFLVGLIIFAIYPAVRENSWTYALLYGAMFGFFTYMTFDLTSLAVLKDYSWQITIIDIIWGIVLSSTVSVATFFIGRNFFN
ncbi:DUF2177 family protein [Candidatus Falkowbacteria bacterium]|nr:DUF2177 family protein [Candidatus Falkowbacteria bacterium]